jgi:hypothetical protein
MSCYYHFTKIEHLTFNNCPMYFRTLLTKEMTRATIFSEKYLYFHSFSVSVSNSNNLMIKPLGNFIRISRHNSGSHYDNYDYNVYEFEFGTVNCKQDGQLNGEIYSIGIPDSDEGMTPVENMFYKECPVFFTL